MPRLFSIPQPIAVAPFTSSWRPAVATYLGPISDIAVSFPGWQLRSDVVQSSAERYKEETIGHVDFQTLTGDLTSRARR